MLNKTVGFEPANPYDVNAWNEFYAANPGYRRSCGADGDNGGGGDGGDGGDGGGKGPTVEELQAQIKSANDENESMRNKMNDLLAETKKAKNDKRASDDAAAQAAADKAKKDGDFEQLYKSSQESKTDLQEKLDNLIHSNANKDRSSAAVLLAGELAEGHNIELLSGFIANRLKVTDEGMKVTDASGNLTVSSMDDLKTEFQNDARYASLLKGNQASGGSASGSGNSGGAAGKTMSRADFDKSAPAKQMEFVKGGGKIFD